MAMWVLAFYHQPEEVSGWLRRAQNVCFGVNENGLPNSGGWILLILSPLLLLAALLVVMGKDIREQLIGVWRSGAGKIFTVILLVLVAGEAAWVGVRLQQAWRAQSEDFSSQEQGGLPQGYARQDWLAPEFELIDQTGQKIAFPGSGNRIRLLTFVFAHCQAVCPSILRTIEVVTKSDSQALDIYLITLDPWRDTPSALPDLAKRWGAGPNTHVLSGEVGDVEKVLDAYRVPRQRVEKSGEVIHPALVYIVDDMGKVAYAFNNPSAKWLLDAVKRLS